MKTGTLPLEMLETLQSERLEAAARASRYEKAYQIVLRALKDISEDKYARYATLKHRDEPIGEIADRAIAQAEGALK